MASVHDVAAAIVDRHGPMSPTKLQKLVYYSQAWHLVWEEEPLFDAPIEAWVGGPVVRSLWDQHRGEWTIASWELGDPGRLTPEERSTVEAIVDTYGKLDGPRLSALTHSEEPWMRARAGLPPGARGNRRISNTDMADFYGGLADNKDARPIDEIARPAPG